MVLGLAAAPPLVKERVLVPFLSLNILLSEPVVGFAGSTARVDVLTTPAGIDVHVGLETLTTMGHNDGPDYAARLGEVHQASK
jgi:hypothetical protein